MSIDNRRAAEALSKIKRHRQRCWIIHYSCQSLYDDRDGLSPRVSSIVVRHLDREQTVSFAVHLTAEKLKIEKTDILGRFDEIETRMLEEFYDFVRNQIGAIWLHWNMKNIHYGFEMLAHRFNILTGKAAPNLDIEERINVAAMASGIYGRGYVGDPQLQKLMAINGGVHRDFIPGKEEVETFRRGEFARLHSSTLSKVSFMAHTVDLIIDRKLKTEKARFWIRAERFVDHPATKGVGVVASIYAIVDLILKGFSISAGGG